MCRRAYKPQATNRSRVKRSASRTVAVLQSRNGKWKVYNRCESRTATRRKTARHAHLFGFVASAAIQSERGHSGGRMHRQPLRNQQRRLAQPPGMACRQSRSCQPDAGVRGRSNGGAKSTVALPSTSASSRDRADVARQRRVAIDVIRPDPIARRSTRTSSTTVRDNAERDDARYFTCSFVRVEAAEVRLIPSLNSRPTAERSAARTRGIPCASLPDLPAPWHLTACCDQL
jgi:hypothetical protein